MGCSLELFRARVGTWAARFSATGVTELPATVGNSDSSGIAMCVLSATLISTLLLIGGIESNPGPGVQENVVKLFCSGCNKNLRSGCQCDSCGKWYHYSCGKITALDRASEKWTCLSCSKNSEARIKCLEVELEAARKKIKDLENMRKDLETQLQKARDAHRSRATTSDATCDKRTYNRRCLVIGDSMVRHVGSRDHSMEAECFPGIRAEQLKRVIEKRDFGDPEAVILHVGTNDSRRNIDYITGDVYDLVRTAKSKFPKSKLYLSGVVRRWDLSWRRVGAINEYFQWVAQSLGICFVDPNSWVQDHDLGRDGLHLNRTGVNRLSKLFYRVSLSDRGKPLINH